jgi:hypothetical protein
MIVDRKMEGILMGHLRKQKMLVLLLIAVMIGGLITGPGLYIGKVYAAAPMIHTLVGEGEPEYGDLKVNVKDGNIMVSRYSFADGAFKFVPQYVENEDHYSESAAVLKFGSDPAVLTDTFVLGAGTSEWRVNGATDTREYAFLESQDVSGDTITTTWIARPQEAYIEIIQRVKLPSKSAQYIDLEWEIKYVQEGESALPAPRFLRGVDGASGNGRGFWSVNSNTVGISAENQLMGTKGVLPSGYTSGGESDVRKQMVKGVLDNEIDNFGGSRGDAYAMQWDSVPGSFTHGASWTIQAREVVVDNNIQIDGDVSETTSGEPVTASFTLQSYGLTPFTVDYEVKLFDPSKLGDEGYEGEEAWTVTPAAGSEELAARTGGIQSGLVPGLLPIDVTITPPSDVALGQYLLTFYYTIKSLETVGVIGQGSLSNHVEVTDVALNLLAPTNVTATPGDGTVLVKWTAVDHATGYWVYQSTDSGQYGNRVATVTDAVYQVTGLTNGTTYYYSLKSVNDVMVQESVYSAMVSATPNAVITPPTDNGGNDNNDNSGGSSGSAPEIDDSGVDVLVNGKVEKAGTLTKSQRSGQTLSTIVVDPEKLAAKLAEEGQHAVVTIPVNTQSDVVVSELNGEMVKSMEGKQAVLEIRTDKATYTLPAEQINIDAISAQIGQSVALQDIKVRIEIATSPADTVRVVENAADKGSFTIVLPPMDFKVTAVYGDTTVDVATFNAYVERMIAIPEGVDPNRITTGVVVEPDGASRHVPTKVVLIDGKYYAVINSLTNSTYSVVWHPLEFTDVANHWAKDAVNNMGSRMVVSGVGDGLYNPNEDITRAEFAEIIVRGLGLKPIQETVSFPDVSASAWYSSAVATAHSYKLISGFEDGTFRPGDKITREQAMMVIAKAMEITGLKGKLPVKSVDEVLQQFTDRADASNWALGSILHNIQAGVVTGRSSTVLAPRANITRAEVAAIVQNLLLKSDLIF